MPNWPRVDTGRICCSQWRTMGPTGRLLAAREVERGRKRRFRSSFNVYSDPVNTLLVPVSACYFLRLLWFYGSESIHILLYFNACYECRNH